jgi:hypothetical protein
MELHHDPIHEAISVQVAAEMALDNFQFPLAISLYLSIPQTPEVKFNTAQLHLLMIDRDQSAELPHRRRRG